MPPGGAIHCCRYPMLTILPFKSLYSLKMALDGVRSFRPYRCEDVFTSIPLPPWMTCLKISVMVSLTQKKLQGEPIKVGLKFLITLGLLYVDGNIDRLYWNIVESVFSASKEVFCLLREQRRTSRTSSVDLAYWLISFSNLGICGKIRSAGLTVVMPSLPMIFFVISAEIATGGLPY